jgi:EmrB/QacA subfamily drug resistance transporter
MWALTREPCDENLIRAAAATAPCPKSSGRWVLVATILASSMAFIDGTVVNVALPALQARLNATAVDLQWVIEAYSLFLSAFLLIGGSLGDHYGRRRIFLLGVSVFTIGSAACGLAANISQLIVARGIQGVGAALLIPGSLAIISSSFSEKDRGPAIGTWSAFSAVTTAIGPVMGGWLIEHLSWRAVFFINVPIAVIVTVVTARYIKENSAPEHTPLDWLGAGLAAAGLGSLVYGLIESSRVGFRQSSVLLVFVAAAILLTFFFVREARTRYPMLPLRLFRSPTFAGANLLTFLLYGALGGSLFFLPLNLIQVQHYSPTSAGAALLPFILFVSLLSRWSGGLVIRYGARIPLIIGPLLAAVGFALFARPALGGSYWTTFFPAIALLGLGMAISVAPLTTTVMGSVSQDHVGIASGINNAIARTAGLVAIAVFGIVMLDVFGRTLDRRLADESLSPQIGEVLAMQRTKLAAVDLPLDYDAETRGRVRRAVDLAFVTGFRTVMLIGAALAFGGALTTIIVITSNPDSKNAA